MKALLIPSAVLVSYDMRKKFGELPTSLFPLGDMTMLEHIYLKYKENVDKIYVVVYKKKFLIKDYIEIKKLPVELIELDELQDLGYTIAFGMKTILEKNKNVEYIYVNFADSLLEDALPSVEQNLIYFSQTANLDDWTYFNEQRGKITDILDKNIVADNVDRISDYKGVFVGVFGFCDAQSFLDTFNIKVDNQMLLSMDSLYRAIYLYSQNSPFLMLRTDTWFDVGHSANYLKAKTSVAARVFNTIEIDEERGILKKSSQNKEKLVNEIKWYLRLPNKLQYLLPRIYDYSLDLSNPYVSMEYYGYHTLHESLMYGDLPLVKWQGIFKKILFAIKDMRKYRLDATRQEIASSLREIYLHKTLARLDVMRRQKNFKQFFLQPIQINGKSYLSLDEYIAMLPSLINQLVINGFTDTFTIIHGDLCFSNIMVEDNYNFIRVIDPRGNFGGYDIYGDPRYELAKLLHTLEGKYDFIIEDMFWVSVKDSHISFQIRKDIPNILHVFMDVFQEELQDILAIRLIEATLFLSMLPLHSDYEKRQYVMLATGILLLDQVIHQVHPSNSNKIGNMVSNGEE